jgi:hypothetical protein
MSASLVLRPEPARSDDLQAIAALHGASWRWAYRGFLPEEALPAPLARRNSAERNAGGRGHVLGIRCETGLSGCFASSVGRGRLTLSVLDADCHARAVRDGCKVPAFDDDTFGTAVSSREVVRLDARTLAARSAR